MNIENKNLINARLMEMGVTLIDPTTTYIDETVVIDKGVTVYPNCFIEGTTHLKEGCTIGANSKIANSIIGANSKIESSWIINSEIGENTTVGPMAHIREHCRIGNDVRIGNFVEMKKTIFGDKSRCAHLTYLGDCEVGVDVNIGCGVVTCNYDGKIKSKTIIGSHSFIGSNANLVAPVSIGDYALVAAGSTVTHDVPSDDMAIARARQTNKTGYGKRFIEK